MRRLSATVGFLLALAAPVAAQDRPADWIKRPTAESLMALWPRAALTRGVGGEAVIECAVSVQGALHQCRVIEESPAGMGFGAAAIALTPQLLMRPALKDGRPVASTVRVPINFEKARPLQGSMERLPLPPMRMETTKVFSNVPWVAAPGLADVQAAYPERARERRVGGRASIDCRISAESRLAGCRILNEEPKGFGFGSAARSLGPRFQGPASGPDGKPLAGAHAHYSMTFAVEMLDPGRAAIAKPQWRSAPSNAEFAASLPRAAAAAAVRAGVPAVTVTLACTVAADGSLADCVAETEEPAGHGFAPAALSLAPKFRTAVWTAEGLPLIGTTIRLPLRYGLSAPRPR